MGDMRREREWVERSVKVRERGYVRSNRHSRFEGQQFLEALVLALLLCVLGGAALQHTSDTDSLQHSQTHTHTAGSHTSSMWWEVNYVTTFLERNNFCFLILLVFLISILGASRSYNLNPSGDHKSSMKSEVNCIKRFLGSFVFSDSLLLTS